MWPVMHAGKPTPSLLVDRQTPVKTLPCPKLRFRAVNIVTNLNSNQVMSLQDLSIVIHRFAGRLEDFQTIFSLCNFTVPSRSKVIRIDVAIKKYFHKFMAIGSWPFATNTNSQLIWNKINTFQFFQRYNTTYLSSLFSNKLPGQTMREFFYSVKPRWPIALPIYAWITGINFETQDSKRNRIY